MTIISTVECNNCNFKFDHLALAFGKSECPSCYSKKLKLLDQRWEEVADDSEV